MELIIGILGLIIAIVAIYFPIWYSKQIKILFLEVSDTDKIDKSISLYFDKIPDEQRIPPDHLIKSLKYSSSALSIKDFKRKIKENKQVVHLPIVAEIQNEIVGFLKAMYVADLNYIFIAYFISKNFNSFDSTRISSALLSKLYQCIKNTNSTNFILFEIVEEEKGRHNAKERLFKHTARARDLKAKHIDATYFIPEVCSFDEGSCNVFPARLMYIDLKNDVESIKKEQYIAMVSSVYKNIYTESYKISEPNLVYKYIEFIELIEAEIYQKTNEVISLV